MKLSAVLVPLIAFALGYCSHLVVDRWFAGPSGASVSYHWEAINDYNDYLRDPSNYEADPGTGFVMPYAPEPHLAALVAAGELEHVDLVFPSVPKTRDTTRFWIAFVEERPNTIVYAEGTPEYVEYKPSGKPPLHLNLWFKEAAKSDVQQLIEELEKLAATTDPQITTR